MASNKAGTLSAGVVSNLKKELITNRSDAGQSEHLMSSTLRSSKLQKLSQHSDALPDGIPKTRLKAFLNEQKARSAEFEHVSTESAETRKAVSEEAVATRKHVTDEIKKLLEPLKASVPGLLLSQSWGLPIHPWHKARKARVASTTWRP